MLRSGFKRQNIAAPNMKAWFEYGNQKWVLERRLTLLIKSHMDDTDRKKDTSFSVHSLTMAYCDFVYWRGLWEVVRNSKVGFNNVLESLAQVVSIFNLIPPLVLHHTLPQILYPFNELIRAWQFSLSILQDAYKDLIGEESVSRAQQNLLKEAYEEAIENLSTIAPQIVEGYGYTEYEMDSALARSGMNPYEALWEGAQKSEMNHMQHLRPAIIGARSIWKNLESSKL
jgi:acyl-CoA oxidase